MRANPPRPLQLLGYGLFCIIDHLCWLIIQAVPGPRLMALIRNRPWRRLQWPMSRSRQQSWKLRIRWLLRTRCRRARWGSTCLSRSLSGRVLLDLIGVGNELHLGMSQFADGSKVPHAWLRDPLNGELLTPGLTAGTGAALTYF